MNLNINSCVKWLCNYFAEHGKLQPRRVIRAEALKAGYTQRELKEARRILGVKLFPEFMPDPAKNELEDYWRLP